MAQTKRCDKRMNALSLFDGMSCGQIALKNAGIKVDGYLASEIDKQAIKVTQKNFPSTIQLGDICNVHVTNFGIEVDLPDGQMRAIDCGKIALVLAGPPCQGFSKAGKGLNFDDPRSKLFFEFVRIWNEVKLCNPDAKFLLENVDMLQEWQDIISKLVGVMPIKINSSLVCAQNRVRLYWTNIGAKEDMFGHMIPGITQPKDRGIILRDVLEDKVDEKYYLSDKALARINRKVEFCASVNPDKTGPINTKNNSGQLSVDRGTTLITDNAVGRQIDIRNAEKISPLRSHDGCAHDNKIVVHNSAPRTGGHKSGGTGPLSRSDGKTYCLNTNQNTNQLEFIHGVINHNSFVEKGDKSFNIDSNYWKGPDNSKIRRLTPIECERLQGVPDNYTSSVSDTQRYKMLGNGWQVDTIMHTLSFL